MSNNKMTDMSPLFDIEWEWVCIVQYCAGHFTKQHSYELAIALVYLV